MRQLLRTAGEGNFDHLAPLSAPDKFFEIVEG